MNLIMTNNQMFKASAEVFFVTPHEHCPWREKSSNHNRKSLHSCFVNSEDFKSSKTVWKHFISLTAKALDTRIFERRRTWPIHLGHGSLVGLPASWSCLARVVKTLGAGQQLGKRDVTARFSLRMICTKYYVIITLRDECACPLSALYVVSGELALGRGAADTPGR